jgi:hypothetical protein
MRRFDASPRKGDAEGPQILHLPRSTASNKISYLPTSLSALVAHRGAKTGYRWLTCEYSCRDGRWAGKIAGL